MPTLSNPTFKVKLPTPPPGNPLASSTSLTSSKLVPASNKAWKSSMKNTLDSSSVKGGQVKTAKVADCSDIISKAKRSRVKVRNKYIEKMAATGFTFPKSTVGISTTLTKPKKLVAPGLSKEANFAPLFNKALMKGGKKLSPLAKPTFKEANPKKWRDTLKNRYGSPKPTKVKPASTKALEAVRAAMVPIKKGTRTTVDTITGTRVRESMLPHVNQTARKQILEAKTHSERRAILEKNLSGPRKAAVLKDIDNKYVQHAIAKGTTIVGAAGYAGSKIKDVSERRALEREAMQYYNQ